MPSESLPLTVLREIDRVCDSFEAAWHAGLKPRIEDYLNVTTLDYRTELEGYPILAAGPSPWDNRFS
jgi:hypothetical protein